MHFIRKRRRIRARRHWAPYNGTGYNAGRKMAHALALQEGERVTNLRLTVDEGGVITGRLLTEEGLPLKGVNIVAWDAAGENVSAAFSNGDGQFGIINLQDERYELRPRSDTPGGFWSREARPGDTVEIVLTQEILQDTQPPEMGWLVDPVTGELIPYRPGDPLPVQ